ncbi:casein kinase II subunit beta [Stemphylium lycopersici]|nr:casein kinase ii subunit beta-2 [Stemphylium lycopersici]RAR07045.1 casein kinase II subunit beta [Stemphylium lycopersici]
MINVYARIMVPVFRNAEAASMFYDTYYFENTLEPSLSVGLLSHARDPNGITKHQNQSPQPPVPPPLPETSRREQARTMDDFNSETDSDYTSYWRDWPVMTIQSVRDGHKRFLMACLACAKKGLIAAIQCKHYIDESRMTYFGMELDRLMILRSRWWSDYFPNFHDFISSRGNEYFCEIDEEYLTDRFNLTGLNTEVQYYQYALDLVTDVFDFDCDDDMREQIEKSARHLYGLVHARYIVTTRGLAKMLEKFKKSDFGKCPRVMCESQPLLPMGQSDVPNASPVKLYCARCEDLYNPKSSRHAVIDGAYFGTSFHNILFQVYPAMLPPKTQRRYEPRVFGFKVHSAAALARWQADKKDEMKDRLKTLKMETGFEEEDEELEDDEDDDDMELQEGVEGTAVQL